jgi:hypothetical protein
VLAVCANAQTLSSPAAFSVRSGRVIKTHPRSRSSTKPPTIDGKPPMFLNKSGHKGRSPLKTSNQIQPGDNTPPSNPTDVLIGFDPKFLYNRISKPPTNPTKSALTVAKRDNNIFQDDYVGFMPRHVQSDKRKAFEVFFNRTAFRATASSPKDAAKTSVSIC